MVEIRLCLDTFVSCLALWCLALLEVMRTPIQIGVFGFIGWTYIAWIVILWLSVDQVNGKQQMFVRQNKDSDRPDPRCYVRIRCIGDMTL